ncbi:MAG: hypothetical protein QM753_13390 [Thermomicrobiales bacterium]
MFWIVTFVSVPGTLSVNITGAFVGLSLPNVARSTKVTVWPGTALLVSNVFCAPRNPAAAAEKTRFSRGASVAEGSSVGMVVAGSVGSTGISVAGISVTGASVTGISVGGASVTGTSVGSTHTGSVSTGTAPGSSACGVLLASNCA